MSPSRFPVDQRGVERWLTYVRALGVLFAVPAVATTAYWPNDGIRLAVWIVTVVFAVGTAVLWWAVRCVRTATQRRRLVLAASIFDAAVISGYVIGFAYEQPYVTWSLVVVLPIAGALRYGAPGAVILAAYGIVLFQVQVFVRSMFVDEPMLSAQMYASGLVALTAAAMTVLLRFLERQNAAYHAQALELAEANRVREQLLAVTSHEFRGSLAAIRASAATIGRHREQLSGARIDRMLTSVEAQVGQLLTLVDDLLVNVEEGGGGIRLRPSWRPAQDLVDVALDAAARHRNGHALQVFVEPVDCMLDHDRIAQVLRNLVENAYKYSPPEGAVVVALETAPDGVRMSVTDSGPGIPADVRERLFEPFHRGAREQAQGSGLGLYVVHRIVAAAGGSVELRSSPRGTTFHVRLPCATRPGDRAAEVIPPVRDNGVRDRTGS